VITWDETKRLKNLKQHGIDLAQRETAFAHPMDTVEDTHTRHNVNVASAGLQIALWY
jgi:uncharacterized DUF497 family protein